MRIDLHTHSAVSDGTDAPAELVARAARIGLDVVALTDHDTLAGVAEARAAAGRVGIGFLAGVELSTTWQGQELHLLGYGPQPDQPELLGEFARLRAGRQGRIGLICARLGELGMPLGEDEVLAQAAGVSVGRPHVADAMVARGYVADRQEAFAKWLYNGGPAFVGRYYCPLGQAITLIRAAGGVSVLAHPWGRGSRDLLTEARIGELARLGLDGIEVDHQDHDEQARAELAGIAARQGLLATGSSDYHGTGKVDHELGCNTTRPEVYRAILDLIGARGGQG